MYDDRPLKVSIGDGQRRQVSGGALPSERLLDIRKKNGVAGMPIPERNLT